MAGAIASLLDGFLAEVRAAKLSGSGILRAVRAAARAGSA